MPVPGHLFAASQPSRSGECTKILSQLVSVVDGIVEAPVKGDADADGTRDFEVVELPNLSEVVVVEASHSSSDLDDDDVDGEDADSGVVDGDHVDRRITMCEMLMAAM